MKSTLSKHVYFDENQQYIASFLDSKDEISQDDISLYNKLYLKDYPYPVRFSVYKLISIIFHM